MNFPDLPEVVPALLDYFKQLEFESQTNGYVGVEADGTALVVSYGTDAAEDSWANEVDYRIEGFVAGFRWEKTYDKLTIGEEANCPSCGAGPMEIHKSNCPKHGQPSQ